MSPSPSWQRLSTGDLMTLWAETPTTPMNVAMLGLLDPPHDGGMLAPAELQAAIADRLDRAPALRHRIWHTHPGQGRPFWADDSTFDVARHVHTVRLRGMSVRQLLSWAATRAAAPLDPRHPLWQLTLITGLAGDELGLLMVMHHAIADGATAVELTGALLDTESGQRPAPSAWRATSPPTPATLVRDATAGKLRALRRATAGLRRTSALRRDLHQTRAALGERAPELGLPVPGSAERRLAALSWPLGAVRDAAHHHRATINDVMLAAVAAGMRNLLMDQGFPVADVSLRVSVPVAAPAGSRNSGGTLPIVLSVPVGDPDPVSTLRRINLLSRQAKAGRDRGYVGPAASPLAPLVLVRLAVRWLRGHSASRINLYLTNVPGPHRPLWLRGARLRAAFPIAPIAAGVPIAAAVLSYQDTLSLTVNADPGVDLDALVDGARNAVEQLAGVRSTDAG
jgi:diacylglycerol O-acyltransferase / wax synthase